MTRCFMPAPTTTPRPTIYLSINGEGFGHSSRAIAIARHLDADEVVVGGYGAALARVQSFGIRAVEVPREIEFVGVDGRFDVAQTILQNPGLALEFNTIVQREMDVMKAHNVGVVVADGRMTPVLAAERLDLPCIILTNQSAFYPFFERESDFIKLLGRSFDYIMSKWMRGAEEIWIPDLPPPQTVCRFNLSDDPRVKMRTRFVGPLTPWRRGDVVAADVSGSGPLVVVSLGGHAYRKPLFDAVISVAAGLSNHRFMIFSSFDLAPGVSCPKNVDLRAPVKDCAPFFKAADVVITQAGHSSAMELLTLGVPTIVVPDTDQIEQENNARKLQDMQTSVVLTYSDLDDPEHFALRRAIELVVSTPSYRENVGVLADAADVAQGAAHAASLLRHYAGRLSAY